MRLFKKKEPKYKVGDWVSFVTSNDFIYEGEIWDVGVSLFLSRPIYQIYEHRWDNINAGLNHIIPERNIIRKVK